jgi:hypothetical protein
MQYILTRAYGRRSYKSHADIHVQVSFNISSIYSDRLMTLFTSDILKLGSTCRKLSTCLHFSPEKKDRIVI